MGKKICYKYLAAYKEMFIELSGDVLLAIISKLTNPRSSSSLKQRLQVFGGICLWG